MNYLGLGKRELICLLSFTCNCVVSVWRGFLFLWVLGMGYVILLWHSLSLPYNHFTLIISKFCFRFECWVFLSVSGHCLFLYFQIITELSSCTVTKALLVYKSLNRS